MGLDREDLGFCVKIVDAAHLHAASRYPEGGILDGLESVEDCRTGIGEPDRGGICKEGADE